MQLKSQRLNKVYLFHVCFLICLYLTLQYLAIPFLLFVNELAVKVPYLNRHAGLVVDFEAVSIALMAIVTYFLAYSVAGSKRDRNPIFQDWSMKRVLYFTYGIYFITIAFRVAKLLLSPDGINQEHYMNLLGPYWIGFIIFPSKIQIFTAIISSIILFSRRPRPSFAPRALSFLLVALILVAGIVTRSRTTIFFPALALVILSSLMLARTRRLFLYALGTFALIFASLVKNQVRSFDTMPIEEMRITEGIEEIFQRISMLANFQSVYNYFESPVWGQSIPVVFVLSSTFFPSEVSEWAMESDPAIRNGNEFGRMFGLIGPNDYNTGVALPLLGDLYLNFGHVGIILGMIILGFCTRRLTVTLYARPTSTRIFFYAAAVPTLVFGLEQQIGSILTEIFRLAIFTLILKKLCAPPTRAPSRVSNLEAAAAPQDGGWTLTSNLCPEAASK